MKLVTPRTTLLALGLALAGAAPALLAQTATAPGPAAGQPGQARQHPPVVEAVDDIAEVEDDAANRFRPGCFHGKSIPRSVGYPESWIPRATAWRSISPWRT